MRRLHSPLAILLLQAVFALAAGCSAPVTGGVPMYRATDEGLMALLHGTLEMRDECLVLVENNGTVWAVLWPSPGTTWAAEAGAIDVHGARASVGGRVSVVGGEVDITESSLAGFDWVVITHEGCLQQDGFWLASQISEQ